MDPYERRGREHDRGGPAGDTTEALWEIAGEMAALANEFPAVDVGAVVVREPCLLTAECELTRRLKRLAELRRRDRLSPSMRIFYDGSDGSGNAMLFAKVFMEETKPHDGNWW